jgi:thiol:disulfide interchange protein
LSRAKIILIVLVALLGLSPGAAPAQDSPLSTLYINNSYDRRANPYRDLERALARAEAENKRVLMVVGGDWCGWCQILDDFLIRDAEVRASFEASFVMLKVNWSPENQNSAFLSGFPSSRGYPDFFVLDTNGAFLRQQDTGLLEHEDDYDRGRMLAFAQRWRR